jgi:hypothetical protein
MTFIAQLMRTFRLRQVDVVTRVRAAGAAQA